MTATSYGDAFGITIDFVGEQAVVSVRGEMDLLTAPALGAFLDAVIATGYSSVALDLRRLDFADLSGLRVITFAASRLAGAGGSLALRSPSTMVRRLLALSELANVVVIDPPLSAAFPLGPEQASSASIRPARGRPISAMPANTDVIDGALRLVVALAQATVGGADGVSVSLRRHGRLTTVAASDQTISDMDISQYATGEGPCVDASIEGRWFHAASLETETRWPAFTPRARALGINAILSSPLITDDRPVGALNIYSRATTAFTPKDQQLASLFAVEASVILTDAGVGTTDDELATRLSEAHRVRRTIARAEGIIMERDEVPADAAFTVLRAYSQQTNRPLHEYASDIVESTQRSRGDPTARSDEARRD